MAKAILLLIASIGIMLIGVKTLGENLQKFMNSKVRKSINKFAKNKVRMSLTGTALTFAMQSSTASTIMTVSLSAVGIFTLMQSICFIIGCNLGSALTDLLLIFNSLPVKEVFASICFVGVVLTFFKKDILVTVGKCLMGFGLIFAGLTFISSSITNINNSFYDISSLFSNINIPILLFIMGIVVTILLQSSFGTLALLTTIISTGTLASANIYSMSYFLYGINIGTTLTTLLVSLSSNKKGKRVAVFHCLFNIFGSIIFILLNLTGFLRVYELITSNLSIQIILLDITFNLVNGIIMLILSKPIEKLLLLFFRKKSVNSLEAWEIDSHTLSTPLIATSKVSSQCFDLFTLANSEFNDVVNFMFSDSANNKKIKKDIAKLLDICEIVNTNLVSIEGDTEQIDVENISYLQFFIKIIKKTINSYDKLIDCGIIDKEKIKLYEKQKTVLKSIVESDKIILNELLQMIKNKNDNNKDVDYQISVETIINQVSKNSELKNKQKLEYVVMATTNTEKKHYVYFNFLNTLQDMTNYISDLAVETYYCVNDNKVKEKQDDKSIDGTKSEK